MCHRIAVEDVVATINSEEGHVTLDPTKVLVQQYTNLRECPGGYKSEFTALHPMVDGLYCGVFGPLVIFQAEHLAEYYDHDQINVETGKPAWMLSQEKIVWKPAQPQRACRASGNPGGIFRPERPQLLCCFCHDLPSAEAVQAAP